ncbi:MAG: hypothetical protein A2X18_11925 [Bacteroidetes bacterium GWF2_40_14]|nr:MAG: hypothetical protein A2X18_11925 [Bacteroidetes bacterium GWF2_40_14]
MRLLLKVVKYFLAFLLSLLILATISALFMYYTADRSIPQVIIPEPLPSVSMHDGYTQYDSSFLKLNRPGLWELHLKGDPSERGLAFGQLCKDLMYKQEKAFVNQIIKIVPSAGYLSFLKYITIIYNRNIGKNIPEEYRKEIYATSLACSKEFDYIGKAYDRQLNYHAAHDLGHAMQEYMLVGCSSFGVWGGLTQDSSLLLGRNFDFYVGDEFAENKIVTFCYPDSGYKFAAVGWAGMVGVLSGMNEKGLTVTLNAAKSSPPISSKTPISIIAREILQYSSNIEEAYNIANSMDAFVSESILIGSSIDGVAAIIEKTPKSTILYTVEGDMIISTNHFQSSEFCSNKENEMVIKSLEGGHSLYRFDRIKELIASGTPLTPQRVARILRDPYGKGNKSIGLTNEKSINQYISHHAVIFDVKKRIMWVSTTPWQLGEMVAYNLDSVFKKKNFDTNSNMESLTIKIDSSLVNGTYAKVLKFKTLASKFNTAIKKKIRIHESEADSLLMINPDYYYSYQLLGEYYESAEMYDKAIGMYEKSLERDVSTNEARKEIIEKLNKLKKL